MPRAAPFVFVLTKEEIDAIGEPVGEGGQQDFRQMLLDQLADEQQTVTLGDEDFARLVRLITRGQGGHQNRMRRAFIRSIREMLGL
jgi:hypothetical protein